MFRGQSWVTAIGEQYGTMWKTGYIKNATPHLANLLKNMEENNLCFPLSNVCDNLNVGWKENIIINN